MPPYKNNRQISNFTILDSHWKAIENMCRDNFRWSYKLAGFKCDFYLNYAYSISITETSEDESKHSNFIRVFFQLDKQLYKLGSGAEGVVFTDGKFVYKSILLQTLSLGCEMNPNVKQALKVGWQLWKNEKVKWTF